MLLFLLLLDAFQCVAQLRSTSLEPGLNLRGIAGGGPFNDLLVDGHDLVAVFLDVADSSKDLVCAQPELGCNGSMMPPSLEVIQDVIHSDPRAGDLRASAAIDDLGGHTSSLHYYNRWARLW